MTSKRREISTFFQWSPIASNVGVVHVEFYDSRPS